MLADELSPTGRALATLDLVQRHPGITARELSQRLGVSERAIRRQIAALRTADIPIEATPGRHGGYRTGRGLRLAPMVFSATQALALVMSVLESRRGGGPLGADDDPVQSALSRLLDGLPEAVSHPASLVRDHARASTVGRLPGVDPTLVSSLVEAVAVGRRVQLRHRSTSGRDWTGLVEPWAVVVRQGLWYLLGHSLEHQQTRTWRIDRVTGAQRRHEPVVVPAGLDPVAELERKLGSGWPLTTRVRFAAPIDQLRHWVSPLMGELTPDGPDGSVLTGTTNDPQMYAGEWLAAIPFDFVVLDGTELRAARVALAERFARASAQAVR